MNSIIQWVFILRFGEREDLTRAAFVALFLVTAMGKKDFYGTFWRKLVVLAGKKQKILLLVHMLAVGMVGDWGMVVQVLVGKW